LDSDCDGILLFITEKNDLVADGGEPMAHAAFGGVDTILETEAEGEIGVARMSKVAQRFSAVPTVGDLPAEEQEDGDGIKGVPTAGGGPAQPLSQDGTQRIEIDQTEDDFKVRKVFQNLRVLRIVPSEVGVVGAVSVLGQRWHVRRDRPEQGQTVFESRHTTFDDKIGILGTGFDGCEVNGHGVLPSDAASVGPVHSLVGSRAECGVR